MRRAVINHKVTLRAACGVIALILLPGAVAGQQVLDNYIREGLESNLTVKRKSLALQKSTAASQEARGYFLPNISINARYSVARGGRTFEFPAGDLLNPLLSNMNALNSAMSGLNPLYPTVPDYPDIDNISFRFLRPNEHETKIGLTQPIYNRTLSLNYRIKQEEENIGAATLELTRRQVAREITDSYYSYLQAIEMVKVTDEMVKLAKENLRVATSLFNNDIIKRDVLYSAEAALARAEMKSAEAAGNRRSAAALFNHILNRPAGEPIIADTIISLSLPEGFSDNVIANSVAQRTEKEIVDIWLQINALHTTLLQSERLPVVGAAIDYGYQGEKYRINSDHDFAIATIALRWNLFAGGTITRKAQQAIIEREMLEVRREELIREIELEVTTSWNNLLTAWETVQAATTALQPAESAHSITSARFREGKASYNDLLQAETAFFSARRELVVKEFNYLRKKAEYRYVTGELLK